MKPYLIRDITASDYDHIETELSGGSRPRILLGNTRNNHKFIFKTYLHNPRELWAEMFVSRLGRELAQKDCFSVQIASIKSIPKEFQSYFTEKYKDYLPVPWLPLGVLIDNAFPKELSPVYAHEVLSLNPKDSISLGDAIEKIKKRYCYSSPENLIESFTHMIVFDALIGNMDRHLENWGILEDETLRSSQMVMNPKDDLKSSAFFTPLFDNGSSCLFELSEEDVERYLQNKKLFEDSYVFSGNYSLLYDPEEGVKNVFQIIERFFGKKENKEMRKYFRKSVEYFSQIDLLKVARVIFKMPSLLDLDYSENRKELLFRSFFARIKKLQDIVFL